MGQGETELEMSQRQVRHGTRNISRQISIVGDLRLWGLCTREAEARLVLLQDAQTKHEEQLARLEGELVAVRPSNAA